MLTATSHASSGLVLPAVILAITVIGPADAQPPRRRRRG